MKWYQNIFTKYKEYTKRRRTRKNQKEQRRRNKFYKTKKRKIIDKGNLRAAYRNRKYFTTEELKKLSDRSKEIDRLKNASKSGEDQSKKDTSLKTKESKESQKVSYEPETNRKINKAKREAMLNADLRAAYRNRKYFTTDELNALKARSDAIEGIRTNMGKHGPGHAIKTFGQTGGRYANTAKAFYGLYQQVQEAKKKKKTRKN